MDFLEGMNAWMQEKRQEERRDVIGHQYRVSVSWFVVGD
jgi:hypothetical protein